MPPLAGELRRALENKIVAARDAAENAAGAALRSLAVDQDRPFAALSETQRRQRNALRAKARQLGGGSQLDGWKPLIEEVAYEQWHKMLFARFLAENNLLIHPTENVPVTLADCAELAPEEGEPDAWMLAARYASAMLPGIFRIDDPSAQVRFAPEGRNKLEAIVRELPVAVFTADDSLGWVYQFWQAKKKDEVNKSGRKIGGEDLAPVTQLFTEHYMVQFLLENSLGAWWAARHPDSPLLKSWEYLRFRDDGTLAAGTFPGWPKRAAEVTVMDPCCGSGHFLVAAFEMLRRMRVEEEGLSEVAAADAVLRDNIYGLEIDPRCTQIAAFALAFAAWKAGGYRQLPLPNIACSGIAVGGQLEEWTALAGDDRNLEIALERLYQLFKDAPTLGSLINPADVPPQERMYAPEFKLVGPALVAALTKNDPKIDPVTRVFGAAVEGAARATQLLSRKYTLVATNVPYLGRGQQDKVLKEFIETHYPKSQADLATVFVERCRDFVIWGGSYSVVTPQNWLFIKSYKELRADILNRQSWNHLSRIGSGGFETIGGEVVSVALAILSNILPSEEHEMTGIDATAPHSAYEKAVVLQSAELRLILQKEHFRNPDERILIDSVRSAVLLEDYAASYQGVKTGDDGKFRRCFWEVPSIDNSWRYYQSTVNETNLYGGLEHILNWSTKGSELARLQGLSAWGKKGVAVSQMGELRCALFSSMPFDSNMAAVIPQNPLHLAAIWAYCRSPEFRNEVRKLDQKVAVTNNTLVKVPFDLEHWQKVADEAGPLPEPYSNDPTQWLFKGNPVGSTEPLQVAVARLLGYCWPQQGADELGNFADGDGIVCLPAVGGEQPAAERLRSLLAAAYGEAWSADERDRLLASVGYAGHGLDTWLRDGFFAQHCKLFHNRPFIWHVWDGRKDGFSALLNYHRLDGARLNRLIYTYLGSWIAAQRAQRDAGVGEADGRLVAALELKRKLEAIRDGEPPYDIYVRWKPLHEQPIGWEPDLNDGVRLNIRPFVTAGVLRSKFTINWNKDRGANPDGSERLNDRHFTTAEKRTARQNAGKEASATA